VEVDFEIVANDLRGAVRRVRRAGGGAPEKRPHARLQFRRAERLCNVVVTTRIAEGNLLGVGMARREDEDQPVNVQLTAHFLSAAVEAEIEHDHIGPLRRGDVDSVSCGRRREHACVSRSERVLEHAAYLGFVVDDENGHLAGGHAHKLARPARIDEQQG
jgi:hypothetical protein